MIRIACSIELELDHISAAVRNPMLYLPSCEIAERSPPRFGLEFFEQVVVEILAATHVVHDDGLDDRAVRRDRRGRGFDTSERCRSLREFRPT